MLVGVGNAWFEHASVYSYVRQDTAEHVQEYTFEAILISMGTDASIWVVRNLRSEMIN